nr:MAG TPA: hypothetical protein [Caudoviricetes sp.]
MCRNRRPLLHREPIFGPFSLKNRLKTPSLWRKPSTIPPKSSVRFRPPPVQRRLHPVHFPTCPRANSLPPPLPFFPFSFTSIPTFWGSINLLFQILLTFSKNTFFSRFPLIDILRYMTAPDRSAGLRGGMLQYS